MGHCSEQFLILFGPIKTIQHALFRGMHVHLASEFARCGEKHFFFPDCVRAEKKERVRIGKQVRFHHVCHKTHRFDLQREIVLRGTIRRIQK